ncbi:FAD-binding protein [Ramlibacter henchirensis]|uniref:FAD-binding protein n=1 Tax=Ramlibacter henchirensis TaxID=204072 RepID=A0A4Z0BWZ5_9BURK|nr:FAD-dependent monooxygenase [Ramlibacter henchirensis]TFZ02778.1 FAD-binding protein [Ramlibacter henchirensis]
MTRVNRVLVVGSGIGGATAAYTLAKAGLETHCIDIQPVRSTVGSGICLLHNTMRALSEIGLAEPCLDSGLRFEVFKQYDATGRPLMSNPTPPGIGIRRPELARILETAASQAGAKMERGLSASAVTDRGDRVEVTFSDGREAAYDLVVAADGAYSKLREQFFGPEHRVWFAGQSAWRFNAPRPPEVDGFCLYRSPDGKRVVGALPTSKETCYLFFLENSAQHLHWPDDQLHILVRERLSAFSAPVVQDALAQVTRPQQVLVRPFDITLVPAPWHRGRVVLLGDSAHSPTPQMTSGGGMAIEDAVVLARCVKEQASVQDALAAYSKRRFERVKTIWDASLQLCKYEQEEVSNPQRSAALLLQTYQYLGQPM